MHGPASSARVREGGAAPSRRFEPPDFFRIVVPRPGGGLERRRLHTNELAPRADADDAVAVEHGDAGAGDGALRVCCGLREAEVG